MYTPMMEYENNMFKFICNIIFWFNSGHCPQVQFTRVFYPTEINIIKYGFGGKI
jgi:hypothetical protein